MTEGAARVIQSQIRRKSAMDMRDKCRDWRRASSVAGGAGRDGGPARRARRAQGARASTSRTRASRESPCACGACARARSAPSRAARRTSRTRARSSACGATRSSARASGACARHRAAAQRGAAARRRRRGSSDPFVLVTAHETDAEAALRAGSPLLGDAPPAPTRCASASNPRGSALPTARPVSAPQPRSLAAQLYRRPAGPRLAATARPGSAP